MGVKGKQRVKNQKGQNVDQVKYFYGYKGHVSMNAESNLITSLEVTAGEVYDGHHFCSLVDQDLAKKLPIQTYTADRGYVDGLTGGEMSILTENERKGGQISG